MKESEELLNHLLYCWVLGAGSGAGRVVVRESSLTSEFLANERPVSKTSEQQWRETTHEVVLQLTHA